MNTCPVYRRAGGLSYGATYSGPIGVILDPGFDLRKYRELPFHSSLCGSCTEVCPVKIDISDQIYKWRRVVKYGVASPRRARREQLKIAIGWWFVLPVVALHARSLFTERRWLAATSGLERAAYAGVMSAAILTLYTTGREFIYFRF